MQTSERTIVRTHRRGFVRVVALGATAGLATSAARAPAASGPEPPFQQPKQEEKSDELDAEVEARMALIVARYGARLDDEARKTIADEVRGIVRRGRRLKEFALDNGDGPFPVFIPFRGAP
jgi:hypothetical protein